MGVSIHLLQMAGKATAIWDHSLSPSESETPPDGEASRPHSPASVPHAASARVPHGPHLMSCSLYWTQDVGAQNFLLGSHFSDQLEDVVLNSAEVSIGSVEHVGVVQPRMAS